ncbi:hypothetical protein IHE56_14190 [Streptomyces sp. ID01-12c]|uniref:sigma factor-like helix-turn-helix DNA-binding protein n=1 Tax=Streptomyces caniscabiei TaxID=2746961 RepID=UPI00177F954C|nr:sigma factor-like helix-turn-helix DNA-binding protein [Streptomyces caniscabiei]MBD9703213.1 hypothetical protein [Streptomyces caniscabiei]MDX3732848.1 sigma factor-like helix-turn-helix DNA-binding protein [Streptomyces caniscabiei]
MPVLEAEFLLLLVAAGEPDARIRQNLSVDRLDTESDHLVGGERQTLEEIGEESGVSRERIRQLETRARDRLKDGTG